ncbi:hypothetical protein DNTS_023125 [Danionella cerebrum]|uniref:EGF-like domain-containing protein n=1 Tax=Danionella cerebrum TaxID=2873325 RepID=A0A553PVT1_9TELE|nr:hypothetical protein DNTS_023125 [Danionella translucida]
MSTQIEDPWTQLTSHTIASIHFLLLVVSSLEDAPLCEEPCLRPSRCPPRCPCQNGGICQGRGVCLCPPGWMGAVCTERCPTGHFGSNCLKECLCHNGGRCDPEKGQCQCDAGYTGERCNEECSVGTYGEDCKSVCDCANGARCYNIHGGCLCEPGFKGPRCDLRMCPDGAFGLHCQHRCLCNSLHTLSCHPLKGECTCQPGWAGLFCNETCAHGNYGHGCLEPCLCVNGGVCDNVHGTCHCASGYVGKHCEQVCEDGFSGRDCLTPCTCVNAISCSPIDGTCFCKEGWTGPDCSVACSKGTWGPACNGTCKCANGAACDPADGSCKCTAGWRGASCDEPCLVNTSSCSTPQVLAHSDQAVKSSVTVCTMKDVRVPQASVCVWPAGQVCDVQSCVQMDSGVMSATRAARASTAAPARQTQESVCANQDSGVLSVNTCAVLVFMEKGAAVTAHHAFMPLLATTLQETVCVCLATPEHYVKKPVPLVDMETSVAVCAVVPTMRLAVIRMVCASVLLDGLGLTALYCARLGHLGLAVLKPAHALQTIHVTLTLESVSVHPAPVTTANQVLAITAIQTHAVQCERHERLCFSEQELSLMVPVAPVERDSWSAIAGIVVLVILVVLLLAILLLYRRRQLEKQSNTPVVSFSSTRSVSSEYAVPDIPHSYHHYYSNPSYHTLSQNRPPLPHLPNNQERGVKNTNNQLFCSLKNMERDRRGLFTADTNATLPPGWKHQEPHKDPGNGEQRTTALYCRLFSGSRRRLFVTSAGAFRVDRSYSYSATLGKHYNKELKDSCLAVSSSSVNSENPYATIKDLPGLPPYPSESGYMEMKSAVPRDRRSCSEIRPAAAMMPPSLPCTGAVSERNGKDTVPSVTQRKRKPRITTISPLTVTFLGIMISPRCGDRPRHHHGDCHTDCLYIRRAQRLNPGDCLDMSLQVSLQWGKAMAERCPEALLFPLKIHTQLAQFHRVMSTVDRHIYYALGTFLSIWN